MKRKKTGWLSALIILFCMLCWNNGRTVLAADNVITDFSRIFYIPAGAMIKGGDLQGLRDIYDSMGCTAYTEDGGELYLDVIWDYSRVDRQTVGAYQITGTVQLPEDCTSKVDLPVWTAAVSVQNPGQPEIHAYSRMIAAGIYYFPWIVDQDPDSMEIWLRKEGEDWVNVSEEGYGFCDTDGMYLSCQSMLPGCIYTLTVTYNGGKTRNLTYRYETDGTLDRISYQPGLLGGLVERDSVIRSCEAVDEKSLQRCMVYAVRTGQSLQEVKKDLEDTFHILGSTCGEFQDTAAYPAVVMPSVWDFGQVDTAAVGVYQVTGTFAAPEGYTLEEDFAGLAATAYIAVQPVDRPEIQTCYMASSDTLFFPMVLDDYSEEQREKLQVYLKEGDNETEVGTEHFYFTEKGLYLKKDLLQMNREYGIYVLYPGGSTGEYVFCLDADLITKEHWYERNYADRDGRELPDIDNGTEKVTDLSTIITGNRLADLLRAGTSQIPFEKDGVLVKVPSDVVEGWNVGADGELQVDIAREDGSFSLKITKNGEEITDIPGATIELPSVSGDGSRTALTDGQGDSYTGEVNETQNVAVIPVDKTGAYTVEEQPASNSDNETEEMDQDTGEGISSEELDITEETAEDKTAGEKEKETGNLAEQHKKTAAFAGIIAILLILLLYLPGKQGRKLRKGGRSEGENR